MLKHLYALRSSLIFAAILFSANLACAQGHAVDHAASALAEGADAAGAARRQAGVPAELSA